jgi:anti-sigma B factor antagonist
MTTALTCTTGRSPDGGTVLAATGEIDMSNAGTFAAALADALRDTTAEPLTVDLTRVDYIDSAGLAVLLPHVDRLRLNAGPLLAPVLTVVGLADLTTVHEQRR